MRILKHLVIAFAISIVAATGFSGESVAKSKVITVPMKMTVWEQWKNRPWPIEELKNELFLKGGPHTNGRDRNGKADGNLLWSKSTYNHIGATSYIKFKTSGAGKYQWLYVAAYGLPVKGMSTHHSWAGSKVVKDNTTYFLRTTLAEDGNFQWALATGNYDDKGGRVVHTQTGKATPQQMTSMKAFKFLLGMNDNYGGTATAMNIYEVKLVLPDPAIAKKKARQEAQLKKQQEQMAKRSARLEQLTATLNTSTNGIDAYPAQAKASAEMAVKTFEAIKAKSDARAKAHATTVAEQVDTINKANAEAAPVIEAFNKAKAANDGKAAQAALKKLDGIVKQANKARRAADGANKQFANYQKWLDGVSKRMDGKKK